MVPNTECIPVTYAAGTGGHFLSYFLNSANINDMNAVTLSEHGNAHYAHISDIPGSVGGMTENPMRPIYRLLESVRRMSDTTGPYKIPYYSPSHICDINLACKYFHKVIMITYLSKDILEISKIFVAKWWLDNQHGESSQISDKLVEEIKLLNHKMANFSTRSDLKRSVLHIEWGELLYGPEIELIHKLSNFTDIPINQFSISNLVTWREKTQKAINQINLLIEKQGEINEL